MKQELNEIEVNGIKYVRADRVPTGPREVIVAEHGWTFYGDVTAETDEYVQLDNGGVVRKYQHIGLPGACEDPQKAEVVVDAGPRLRVLKLSIISRHSVRTGWPK